MKRPISILCLADIHFDVKGDMSAFKTLYSEFAKFIDTDKNRVKWLPDYIVIAGDVADKNGGYNIVKKLIQRLCSKEAFNIANNHVIVVPGNHDKNTEVPLDQHDKDIGVFDKYCEKCDGENVVKFGDVFADRFDEYIKFSKKYTSNLKFNSKGNNSVLDKRLRCLSGVKVFDDDHICFLYVNTEWLYVSGRDKAIVKKSKHEDVDFSKFVRLDENCILCAPLVKDACNYIKNHCSSHKVITVMHRGFDHFSWKEKNPTDAASIDSIGYLLKYSDIIISGHDHVFSPAPPTLIGNRVQHFQLGAAGIKEPRKEEFQRSAEIIRLDVSNEKVEQLFIEYKNTKAGFQWCFEESQRDYPLFSRFLSKSESAKVTPYHLDTLLNAKSSSKKDIERSISTYFNLPSSYKLKTIAANSDIKNRIESLVSQNEGKFLYIVIYYHYSEYMEGVNIKNSSIASIKQRIDQFKNEHIKELMSYQIIINEVIMDYPLEYD